MFLGRWSCYSYVTNWIGTNPTPEPGNTRVVALMHSLDCIDYTPQMHSAVALLGASVLLSGSRAWGRFGCFIEGPDRAGDVAELLSPVPSLQL